MVGARADARTGGGDVRGDRQVGIRKCASVSNGPHRKKNREENIHLALTGCAASTRGSAQAPGIFWQPSGTNISAMYVDNPAKILEIRLE